MLDVVLSIIHTQFILTGAAGGFLHSIHDRKLDPKEVARYIFAAIVISNLFGPLVLELVLMFVPSAPLHTADGVGGVLGYGVSRFCQFANRYLDKELKSYERPKHE